MLQPFAEELRMEEEQAEPGALPVQLTELAAVPLQTRLRVQVPAILLSVLPSAWAAG